jgi:hypothetical protein
MRHRSDLPRDVRVIPNTWITMPDGVRLGAKIWLPPDAEEDPVPAILEYVPYRKDDNTAERDEVKHRYVAGHGYAVVRVDVRGTGASDGILDDEYTRQEQLDGVAVIQWLAEQPWCSGSVGMIGISWGGFNALQIAAHRPPALKAIVTLCSTDDRYADDVHYMGGCVDYEMLSWASTMLCRNAMPPRPDIVGERWREIWLDRLERTPAWIDHWLGHQRRDDYWKQGSVCEDYAAIDCAVYAVGGWSDGYSNAIPRLLEHLDCPKKGLIGPWGHKWPEAGVPGPAIGFLQECLRWWDHWLKGVETGIMDEPLLRAWIIDSPRPSPTYAELPGRWVPEPSWPSPLLQMRTLALNLGRLEPEPAPEREMTLVGQQLTGRDSGIWCPYGNPGDFPLDQRADDGMSLCFESDPLPEPLELLGFPEVTLTLAADKPNALVAVRLGDVWPDGATTRISWGLLNLTHRDSHEFPEPLEPGQRYTVTVRLNAIGWSLPAGHRLRVAVSPTYWAQAWPSPETVALSIFTGGESRLSLPVRPPRVKDADLRPFDEPESAPPLATERLTAGREEVSTSHDILTGRFELTLHADGGVRRQSATGYEIGSSTTDSYSIIEGDPLSARAVCERSAVVGQGNWRTRVETRSQMTADATHFWVTDLLEAYEGETRVFARSWSRPIPRDHV